MSGSNMLTMQYMPWDERLNAPCGPDTNPVVGGSLQPIALKSAYDSIVVPQQTTHLDTNPVGFSTHGLFYDDHTTNSLLFSDDPSSDNWVEGGRKTGSSSEALGDLMASHQPGVGSSDSLTNISLLSGPVTAEPEHLAPPSIVDLHQNHPVWYEPQPQEQQHLSVVEQQDPLNSIVAVQQQQPSQTVVVPQHNAGGIVVPVVDHNQQQGLVAVVDNTQAPSALVVPVAQQPGVVLVNNNDVSDTQRRRQSKRPAHHREWRELGSDLDDDDDEGDNTATRGGQRTAPHGGDVSDEEYKVAEEDLLADDDDLELGSKRKHMSAAGINGGGGARVLPLPARAALQSAKKRFVAVQPIPMPLTGDKSNPIGAMGGASSSPLSSMGARPALAPRSRPLQSAKPARPVRSRPAGVGLGSDGDDPAYRAGRAGNTGGPRSSRRLQQRALHPYQGHLPLDSDFVTYDPEEPGSPGRGASPTPAQRRQRVGGASANGAALGNGTASAGQRGTSAAAAKRRSINVAAQRIRATSSRHELKGRPSFAEIVEAGFMRPGTHRFAVGNVEVSAAVGDDGAINYAGARYRAISKFALVVLRERNPSRQSCDGWKEVAWNGEKLDVLRVRVQQHIRQQMRRG